jgi:hypothetical protein
VNRSRPSRAPSNLSDSILQQLNMYALAASAAGVGLLALAQPAESKIVYTPANVKLVSKPFPLDFNHDGVVDFFLLQYRLRYHEGGSSGFSVLSACHGLNADSHGTFCTSGHGTVNSVNAVRVLKSKPRPLGAALRPGAKIQRSDEFRNKGRVELGRVSASTATRWYGPWVNGGKGVKNRYLGVKFQINGRFHYGWARMTVTTTTNTFTATLTGYAYETIPGKAIVAGQTKGTADMSDEEDFGPGASLTNPIPNTPQPASLGMLALGAQGVPWRRKESVGITVENN